MGLLTHTGAPDWHPAPAPLKQAAARAAALCAERGADLPGLALRYALRGPADIATTLVGIGSTEILERTLAACSGEAVTEARKEEEQRLVEEVLDILRPVHNVTWRSGREENWVK